MEFLIWILANQIIKAVKNLRIWWIH